MSPTTPAADAATAGSVERVVGCTLRVSDEPWPFARMHAAEIDAHWERRSREGGRFFNGIVYVLSAGTVERGHFHARMRPVEFKCFLYWRDRGFPEAGVCDAFGSAVIRSSEGHVILGRQAPGNLNSGLAYMPGGFIDPRDVGPDGSIDIAANVLREVAEETGLGAADLERVPGFLLTRCGPQVSIGVEWRSRLPSTVLAARIAGHLAADKAAELSAVEIVRTGREIAADGMPPFTAVLLRALFA